MQFFWILSATYGILKCWVLAVGLDNTSQMSERQRTSLPPSHRTQARDFEPKMQADVGCQVKDPKPKMQSLRSQAKDPNPKLPRQRSQTHDPDKDSKPDFSSKGYKPEVPRQRSKAKGPKPNIPKSSWQGRAVVMKCRIPSIKSEVGGC